MEDDPSMLRGIEGLHFHSNCDSSDFGQLLKTVTHLDTQLGDLLSRMRWINIGGGYLFEESQNLDPLYEALTLLKGKYDLEVFIEPGAALIRDAGYIVSSVLDIFESDAKRIAILDTAVNHMPEVFEYQFEPDVIGHRDEGEHEYILAGCTCLSGDVFGEYRFDELLEIGSRVIFSNMGAYTLVKAHMFNGVNLPTIYSLTESGELVMKKRFSYEDFASRCGVETRVTATAKG
jgi:carboxynorspermidine decarboxylase